jgi:hypothetical protein
MSENEIKSGNPLDSFKQQFKEYQTQGTKPQRKTLEEIQAKYFMPRKQKEMFRILPYKGEKFYEEAHFHVVDMLTSGGVVKKNCIVYCPAHNDPQVPKIDPVTGNPAVGLDGKVKMVSAPCPLCVKYKKKISQQDDSIKYIKTINLTEEQKVIKAKNDLIYKDAIQWEAKKFYIVKGIDKGIEKDGPKFWRFKHNFKNNGTLDKIYPVLEDFIENFKCDFSSPTEGTDLSITMGDATMPNGRVYKTITAMLHKGKTLLHADPIVSEQWLADNTTWREVFPPKKAPNISNSEMLHMIADGSNPYFDRSDESNKHWVFPGRPDLEELANTKNKTFEADEADEYSEDDYQSVPTVVTNPVAENAVDVVESFQNKVKEPVVTKGNNYEDLPF